MNDKDRPKPPRVAFAGALGARARLAPAAGESGGSSRLYPPPPRRYGPARLPPLAKTESDDGLHTRPHAPGTLVPGLHSCSAAVLGRSGLLDPAAVRYGDGSGHFSSRNHAARARAETVEGRLCAAFAPADGRPLWRKSKSAAPL